MPILDPVLQFHLLDKDYTKDESNCINFYIKYILLASRNIHKNFSTIQTSIAFKEDLKSSLKLVNYKFGCQLTDLDLDNVNISNYYKLFYNKIKNSNLIIKKRTKLNGNYFVQNNDSSIKFFQPNVFFSSNHSWFFSDTSAAILCINFNDFSYKDTCSDFFQMIKLETDLLQASGFTLVLCTNYTEQFSQYLIEMIYHNQFAEIHFNYFDEIDIWHFVNEIKNKYVEKLDLFDGYFYFYTPVISQKSVVYEYFKKLRHRPRFLALTFPLDIKFTLKKISFNETRPFSYCESGFCYDKLRISLSNVPIYDSDNEKSDIVPSETSGILNCYILSNNFLSWENKRVKIVYDSQNEFKSYVKYINFEDIHQIKKDFYVNSTLFLTNIEEESLYNIDKILKKYKLVLKHRKFRKFPRNFFRKILDYKIKDPLVKIIFVYACTQSFSSDFIIHKPQLYTLIEALNSFNSLNSSKEKIDNNKSISNTAFSLTPNLIKLLSDPHLSEHIKNILTKILLREKYDCLDDILKNNSDSTLNNLEIKTPLNYSKGFIYQVETGEGKSCIISILAAILAIKGKTVHIASSNIKLANRDYMESFDFFESLGLRSDVLLHIDELPYNSQKKKADKIISNENDSTIHSDIDLLFKENENNYYQKYTQCDNTQYNNYYNIGYSKNDFNNSSRMNFSVSGFYKSRKKSDIVFSTFLNFECLYFKILEEQPSFVDKYFKNCVLIIDEADSILIDELANGTIVSKDIKSNTKDVLLFVYHNKKNGISAEDTLIKIKEKWPKCADIKLIDIERMYLEIDIVNQDEFKNGKRYSIEEYEVENETKKNDLSKSVLNFTKKIVGKVFKGLQKEFTNNDDDSDDDDDDDSDDDDDDDSDSDDNNDSNDDINKSNTTIFRHIVPFDYDHKGILEPNKEFSGFIQQFIAIKESEENKIENMVIKDISMSYLYISHPIFVKLYGNVFGFTGTLGNKKDQSIYKNQYNLITKKIPRNEPNQRIQLPNILCKTYQERNEKIISEVIEFHKKGNPVLVIFEDLKEIDEVGFLLNANGIKYYNVFNGKNDNVTPELIGGQESSISLGTNVCGRGMNIIAEEKPLHVIISYYTSNTRVIKQAHGRTARRGQKGTSRIICTVDNFLHPSLFSESGIDEALKEFRIKDQIQAEYVELIKELKPWIFEDIGCKKIDEKSIMQLRDTRINVNRIVAYNYEFPLKMSIETFMKIQSQKIFSIVNCPNSKYTWMLFQRYLREMIYESWSLMINEVDETFFEQEENKEFKKQMDSILKNIDSESFDQQLLDSLHEKSLIIYDKYEKELKRNRNKLLELLNEYISFNEKDIVPSFMHIYNKTKNEYEDIILNSFGAINECYFSLIQNRSIKLKIGFEPFSLLTESGARINFKNFKKTNYIKDPEIKYLKRTNKKISLLSITEKIDDIFNNIFQKINQLLGEKTFLKFFMRRTLFGCEFGICFDFSFNNSGLNDPYCIIDKDPMILFTLCVRSVLPILAGILIAFLVYVASIAKDIAEWIAGFPEKLTKELILKGVFVICNIVSSELMNFTLDKFIKFLKKTLEKQLDKLKTINETAFKIIDILNTIFSSSIGEHINKKLSSILGDKIKITFKWQQLVKNCFDPVRVMKISLLLLLCFASFLFNFNSRKDALRSSEKNSIKFQNFQNNANEKDDKSINEEIDKLVEKSQKMVTKEKGEKLKDTNTKSDCSKISQIGSAYEKVSKTYLYKYKVFNPNDMIVKFTDFVDDNKEILKDSCDLISDVKYCIQKKGKLNTRCARFQYSGFRNILMQQIRIYATNKCPSILNMIGYSIRKKKQYLFVENKGNGTLESIINNPKHFKINQTQKLIIAYGVASALESLHKNNIIHRNLNLSNISLDKDLHPYLSDFYFAVQIDTKLPYVVTETTPEFMSPEFIQDSKSNQLSFKLDVYSYGIVLFMLITENNPFKGLSKKEIFSNTLKGKRPDISHTVNKEWKELIIQCWDQNPTNRPTFTNICNTIEKFVDMATIDLKSFNNYKEIIKRNIQ